LVTRPLVGEQIGQIGTGPAGRWQEFKAKIGKPLQVHYDSPLRGTGKTELEFPTPVVISALRVEEGDADWLWNGFIAARGITLLSALWKVGKTTLLAHLLREMGRPEPEAGVDPGPLGIGGLLSRPSLCGRPVTPGNVLCVTEESERNWIKRRDALHISDNVHIICRPFKGKPTTANWVAFLQHIQHYALAIKASLVVLDTLSSLWPVRNENDASEVQAALMPLWGIAKHSAILANHHLKKGDGAEATGSRGSGALPGFVDTIMELRRYDASKKESRKRVITAYGRDDETPAELVIELDPTTNEYRGEGVKDDEPSLADSRCGRLDV
jgi:hypothetical protein